MDELKLFSGRPEDVRIPKEERCYELLGRLGIDFLRVDHAEAATMEACQAAEKVLGCEIAKNLLLTNRQQTDIYLLIMPAEKPFKTKVLSKLLGVSRLSFATAEQMIEKLDIAPGSLSILGLMNDSENAVRLVIDREVYDGQYLGCHPCINTSSLKIDMNDVKEKLIPAMGHAAAVVDLPWVIEE